MDIIGVAAIKLIEKDFLRSQSSWILACPRQYGCTDSLL